MGGAQPPGRADPDTSQDARWLRRPDDAIERSGPKSAICVPILVRDELVGVLTLVHANPNFLAPITWPCCRPSPTRPGSPSIMPACTNRSRRPTGATMSCSKTASIQSCLTNLEGKIQEANRQAVQVSGRTREELQGTSIWDLQTEGPAWLQENMQRSRIGETVSCESEFHPRNRSPIPVEIYVHKISFGGEELLQWIIRDITERKQLDALRDDLSAMIYHDLRSPLANIVSSLDMLRALIQESENNIMQQVLSIAIRSSERMQRLINSLLDINRLEAGQPITNRKSVEVSPLILEAMDAVQPITSTKRQRVLLEVEPNLPKIWVDEDMIRRVLINLLENATKFTPVEGEITVGAKAKANGFAYGFAIPGRASRLRPKI